MFKRSISVMLVTLILLASFATTSLTAFAVEEPQGVVCVDKDYAKAIAIAEKANEKILSLVNAEMEKKNPNVDKLVEKTNKIAAKAIEKIEDLGFEAACEYTEYVIGGQTVLIDPIFVIRR